jgi:aquaporin Z
MRRSVRSAWNAVIAEGVGTFLFLFVALGAAITAEASDAGLIRVALATGLALVVLIPTLAPVSGAHFNPAVTFGVWLVGNIDGRRALAYVLAQSMGAILAATALLPVFATTSGLARPTLGPGIDSLTGVGVEAVLTGVLFVAVVGTAIDSRAPKLGALLIGLAVAAGILMGGPLTAAAMNPARWLGPAIVTGDLSDASVWILGPLLGAGVVALVYRYLLLPVADVSRTPGDPTGDGGAG